MKLRRETEGAGGQSLSFALNLMAHIAFAFLLLAHGGVRDGDGGGGEAAAATAAITGGGGAVSDAGSEVAAVAASNSRKSLLDVIEERAVLAGRREKVHRLVIAGRLSSVEGAVAPGAACEKFLSSAAGEEDSPTGLFMQLPGCFFHVIECGLRTSARFVRALSSADEVDSGVVGVKVLSSIQDAPNRSFSAWASRVVSGAKGDAAVPDKDSVPKMVSDMSLAVQKIGNKLQEMSGADAIAALDALRTKFPEAIPRVEDVLGLLDCPFTMELEEFVTIFYGPVKLTLDSEVEWPMPKSLLAT